MWGFSEEYPDIKIMNNTQDFASRMFWTDSNVVNEACGNSEQKGVPSLCKAVICMTQIHLNMAKGGIGLFFLHEVVMMLPEVTKISQYCNVLVKFV